MSPKAELRGPGCHIGACWWLITPRGGALRSRRPAGGRVRHGPAHRRPRQMLGLATSRVGALDEYPHCKRESGYWQPAAFRLRNSVLVIPFLNHPYTLSASLAVRLYCRRFAFAFTNDLETESAVIFNPPILYQSRQVLRACLRTLAGHQLAKELFRHSEHEVLA